MNNEFIDYFLAFFYSFVAVFYFILIRWRQYYSPKTKFINIGQTFNLHWINHITFRIFRVMIWSVCVTRLVFPDIDFFLGEFTFMHTGTYRVIGVAFLLTGFNLAVVSNISLKRAWRSGVDIKNTPYLVTQGIYGISRNPAYIGVGMAQLGFFFALPSIFSLCCTLFGLNALRIQVKLEEKHLSAKMPSEYNVYRQNVARWM